MSKGEHFINRDGKKLHRLSTNKKCPLHIYI